MTDILAPRIDTASVLNAAMNEPIKGLLSIRADHKTIKGEKYGVLTGVVYMAPGDLTGHEMCPARTPGCTKACLFTAGKGAFGSTIAARMRRTYQFINRQQEFMLELVREIEIGEHRAAKLGMAFAVRLNGTSDIAYEDIPVVRNGVKCVNVFAAFPSVYFYDYTKRFDRLENIIGIHNYSVTFSYAETKKNHAEAAQALEMGFSVAVVMESLQETFMGVKVIDGDDSDVRFWDAKNNGGPVVVGLKPKGKARNDTSGFVVRYDVVAKI
jgi:hypothetical protein